MNRSILECECRIYHEKILIKKRLFRIEYLIEENFKFMNLEDGKQRNYVYKKQLI